MKSSFERIAVSLLTLCLLVIACDKKSGLSHGGADGGPDGSSDGDTDGDADGDAVSDGDADGDAESTVVGDADFEVEISLSDEIASVGIVEWSIDKSGIDSASVEFGRDTDYEFSAPVDLKEPGYRTLLLGMKPETEYHLRIVARDGDTVYRSGDYTIETGLKANGLPSIELDTHDSGALLGGFTIACSFGMGGGGGGPGGGGGGQSWVYIIDEEGDYVWWYRPEQGGADCVRARMSLDGKYMFVGNGNVPGVTSGTLVRVTMDGLEERAYDLPRRHHDLTMLPDGKVAFFEYDENSSSFGGGGCDIIKELDPETGTTKEIYTISDDFSSLASQNGCHTNAINYVLAEDALSVSVLNFDAIILISLSGNLIWTFGGSESDFSGASWNAQHQHQVLDGGIVLFNNSGSNGSSVLEFKMEGDQAERVFEYSSGLSTQSMGDAKRLSNGNTLVTYSNAGVTHEVDESGELVQTIDWGGGVGYTVRRKSLYGPPPEYL